MKERLKKIKLHIWAIAGTLLGGALMAALHDYIKDNFFDFLRVALKWTITGLNYDVKVYVILSVIIIFGAIFLILINLPKKQKEAEIRYTSDVIKGIKWEWTWDDSGTGIRGLVALCPNDDTGMIQVNNAFGGVDGYRCPRCEHKLSGTDLVSVYAIIMDNLKNIRKSGTDFNKESENGG